MCKGDPSLFHSIKHFCKWNLHKSESRWRFGLWYIKMHCLSEMIPLMKTPQSSPKKVTCCINFCKGFLSHTRSHSWTMVRFQNDLSYSQGPPTPASTENPSWHVRFLAVEYDSSSKKLVWNDSSARNYSIYVSLEIVVVCFTHIYLKLPQYYLHGFQASFGSPSYTCCTCHRPLFRLSQLLLEWQSSSMIQSICLRSTVVASTSDL